MIDNGVWVSVSELARQRGVDKSSVSRRIARLEAQKLLTTRADGQIKLINVAEYDRAVGKAGDAIKEQAAKPAEDVPGLAAEQTKRTAYMAELARLDLEERTGKLIPVADVEAAMVRCAEVVVRVIDQLPAMSDDPAVRVILKEKARELRETLAREMRLIQQADTEQDEPEMAFE